MFDRFKKLAIPDKASSKHSKKQQKWPLRNPSTRYDKYIEEHRSFNEKKRGNAWFELSGGKDMRSECGENYYKKVVEYSNRDPNSKDNIQIEKDIARTNLKGCPELTAIEQDNLREVLRAVSYELRLEGGYCQSMNFIAALLLLHMEKELAFYTQVCINRLIFSNYFTEDLFGVRVDERIFLSILSERLPDLADHLTDHDISLSHLTFHWFLCLFINVLPLEVTEYIWDRVFYFGSHVIHAAALTIFMNYNIILRSLNDLEEIVMFLNEKLEDVSINDFSGIETSGLSLPRIRILRSDYSVELKKEEKEVKKQITTNISQSFSRQKSMRMSVTSLSTTQSTTSTTSTTKTTNENADVECSYKLILRMKNEVVSYLLKHCAESYGISPERVTSRKLRDFCYAGFSKDEFLSLWNILYRVGIVTQQDPNAYLEIFKQYARMRHGQQIVDIREVLIGFINTVTEKIDIQTRLQYVFSVYDMKNEGIMIKQSFTDFISVVYEDCKVEDVDRAAEKYVKIVFAVNTQSPDVMTYQEFYSLVVIQPQIVNYLQLVDISEEESLTPTSDEGEKQETDHPTIINLKDLPPFLAQHPYVQNACKWPEKEQVAFESFLQDIACLIQDRNELRQNVSSNNIASYRNSYQKSVQLSSNRLLGTNLSRRSRTPMESIYEDDEGVEGLKGSDELSSSERPSLATMTVSVRRRMK